MKKIITLLLAAGAFVTLNAQTSREEARKVILGGGKNSDGGNSSTRGRDVILGEGNGNDSRTYPNSYPENSSRQARIDQVNREYDAKIYSIRNNGQLSQAEKDRTIRQLEKDRQRKIQQINQNSNNKGYKSKKNKKYDDDDDRYEGRHDNGKHKGWTKGKGNQKKNKHRDRDDD